MNGTANNVCPFPVAKSSGCCLKVVVKLKFYQDFKACWSFCSEIKLLNESKYSISWVRCAFSNESVWQHSSVGWSSWKGEMSPCPKDWVGSWCPCPKDWALDNQHLENALQPLHIAQGGQRKSIRKKNENRPLPIILHKSWTQMHKLKVYMAQAIEGWVVQGPALRINQAHEHHTLRLTNGTILWQEPYKHLMCPHPGNKYHWYPEVYRASPFLVIKNLPRTGRLKRRERKLSFSL